MSKPNVERFRNLESARNRKQENEAIDKRIIDLIKKFHSVAAQCEIKNEE